MAEENEFAELSIGPAAIQNYSRLSYTMWNALAEFIDNSTQSRTNYGSIVDDLFKHEGTTLVVEIDYNALKRQFAIKDMRSGVYHSRMKMRARVEVLSAYREGAIDILITCRALDEGFNVPETEIGIVAASTATRRQRIQRLGRVLRPVRGKESATIYTLVATKPEINRLQEEEKELEGVATVTWGQA